MGREGSTTHGVRVMFTSCRVFNETKIYIFMFCIICFILSYKSLKWWFHCIRLQTCVGSVCVGGLSLMCHGRECARLGSGTRLIFFYVTLVGGGLRPSGTSSGSSGSVRSVEVYVPQDPHQGVRVVFGYTYVSRERYTPNVYRYRRT